MTKYQDLDAKIIEKIAEGVGDFGTLTRATEDLEDLAKPHCSVGRFERTPTWRIVDRRLQALRKAGKISYSRATGWRVTA